MNTFNFNDIWVLMSNHKFSIDPEPSYDDLLCLICHELMIDAYESICGCQYCHKCIKKYLGDKLKYCPGGKSECREEYLFMDITVTRNVRMNKRISNLKVYCPNELCQSKIELSKMNEHLRLCMKQSMECHFVTIDGGDRKEVLDSITAHLNNYTLIHSQLLIESINNLKNEVTRLLNNSDCSKIEISSLKENSQKIEIKFRETFEQMAEEKREIIEQMAVLEREKECLKEDSLIKENLIATLEEQLKEGNNKLESILLTTDEEMEKINVCEYVCPNINEDDQRGNGDVKNEGLEEEETIEMGLSDSKGEIKVTLERTNGDRESRIDDWIQSCPNNDADFVWRIEDWKKKRETMQGKDIFSESFYSNNYNLCLRMRIYNDDDIWLWCHIMAGDNDDEVLWPMGRAVTLAVVDQDTLRVHRSVTIKHESNKYDKSVFDRSNECINNCGIGTHGLIKYSSIKDKPSIIVNDSIIVSCITSD